MDEIVPFGDRVGRRAALDRVMDRRETKKEIAKVESQVVVQMARQAGDRLLTRGRIVDTAYLAEEAIRVDVVLDELVRRVVHDNPFLEIEMRRLQQGVHDTQGQIIRDYGRNL